MLHRNSLMLRLIAVAVLLGCAGPAPAEDKKVTLTFLGGAKKVPLEGLTVTIRAYTGDWSVDRDRKPLANSTTDKGGTANATLADGWYYVEIVSAKELPYLDIPVGYKGYHGYYRRMVKVGKEQAFAFNLADACQLTLRAVDENGKGIPGVSFQMLSPTAESGGAVIGDNLGVDRKKQGEEVTDKDGNLVRYMAPWDGYTYFAWPTPKGYEHVGDLEVTIPTPLGKEKAEHVFKFRKQK
jgi:hypothetical protein